MPLTKRKACPPLAGLTRRHALALMGASFLAGCSAIGASSGPEVDARLLQSRQSLRVSVTGLRPGERVTGVTLIAPDEAATAVPPELVRQRPAGDPGPSRGVSVQGSSDGTVGVGVSFDLIGRVLRGGRRPPNKLSLEGAAQADIPIQDPAALMAEPEAYRVEVQYRDTEGVTRSLAVTPRV